MKSEIRMLTILHTEMIKSLTLFGCFLCFTVDTTWLGICHKSGSRKQAHGEWTKLKWRSSYNDQKGKVNIFWLFLIYFLLYRSYVWHTNKMKTVLKCVKYYLPICLQAEEHTGNYICISIRCARKFLHTVHVYTLAHDCDLQTSSRWDKLVSVVEVHNSMADTFEICYFCQHFITNLPAFQIKIWRLILKPISPISDKYSNQFSDWSPCIWDKYIEV